MDVRCCCCGKWLVLLLPLKQEQQIFCDSCAAEGDPTWRIGPGRGQCQSCMMCPEHSHWNDKKPVRSFQVCIR